MLAAVLSTLTRSKFLSWLLNMEQRAIGDLSVKDKKIIGRPIVYGSRSHDLGGFVEVIAHGAFSDSLQSDVRALVEHDHKLILGRTGAGTMRIMEDNQGLIVEIDPPNTRSAQDLLVSIERGDIRGMSFGFTVPIGGDEWDYNTIPPTRVVKRAELKEVTVTSMPAYAATNVTVAQRALNSRAKAIQTHLKHLELLEVE